MVFPSGSLMILTIFANVPIWYKSLKVGWSMVELFWLKIPINSLFLCASSKSLMDISLPAVIGITTLGNITIFLTGRIGKIFCSLFSSVSLKSFKFISSATILKPSLIISSKLMSSNSVIISVMTNCHFN